MVKPKKPTIDGLLDKNDPLFKKDKRIATTLVLFVAISGMIIVYLIQ